jgi:hypothetical protein
VSASPLSIVSVTDERLTTPSRRPADLDTRVYKTDIEPAPCATLNSLGRTVLQKTAK